MKCVGGTDAGDFMYYQTEKELLLDAEAIRKEGEFPTDDYNHMFKVLTDTGKSYETRISELIEPIKGFNENFVSIHPKVFQQPQMVDYYIQKAFTNNLPSNRGHFFSYMVRSLTDFERYKPSIDLPSGKLIYVNVTLHRTLENALLLAFLAKKDRNVEVIRGIIRDVIKKHGDKKLSAASMKKIKNALRPILFTS